jgi:hypothetical protein
MTRGRLPQKGLDVAIPIAKERGQVMEFLPSSENICEFLIIGNGCLAMVRVRKARRLHGTSAEVETDFSEAVIKSRAIPCGGPVSRELWLYSRFCVMRFFQITDAGLVEIDRHGLTLVTVPVKPAVPATAAPSPETITKEPELTSVQGCVGGSI